MCKTKGTIGRGRQRQSRNEVESRKKDIQKIGKNSKKQQAWTTGVREKLNGRQSYRGGRGPTEETQRCRNNKGIEREAHIKLRGKSRRCGGWRREKTEREGTNGKIVTRELKQRERGTLSVRTSVHARISHLHRNKLAGTIGSSVHSDTANTVQPCSPNRKPLQYALLTLSTQRGPYHRPDVIFCMSYNNFVPGNVFVNRGAAPGSIGMRSAAWTPPRCLFTFTCALWKNRSPYLVLEL